MPETPESKLKHRRCDPPAKIVEKTWTRILGRGRKCMGRRMTENPPSWRVYRVKFESLTKTFFCYRMTKFCVSAANAEICEYPIADFYFSVSRS